MLCWMVDVTLDDEERFVPVVFDNFVSADVFVLCLFICLHVFWYYLDSCCDLSFSQPICH